MQRQTIADFIILAMVLAVAGLIIFRLYHSRERSNRRSERREDAAYDELMERKRRPRE